MHAASREKAVLTLTIPQLSQVELVAQSHRSMFGGSNKEGIIMVAFRADMSIWS